MFSAKKIWLGDKTAPDTYVDFRAKFSLSSTGGVTLKLAADSRFCATLSGALCAFGECADFPTDKEYYTFDLSPFAKVGENELIITVWHFGADSSTYIKDDAFLSFAVEQNGKVLACSGETTEARRNPYFASGFCKRLTTQLGFSYDYDANAKETTFESAEVVGELTAADRGIRNLSLGKPKKAKIVSRKGSFIYDLGEETVGYLTVDYNASHAQKLTVAYGEHLRGGHVVQKVGARDFSVAYTAKKGNNAFVNPMRRLAGRYLEVFSEDLSDLEDAVITLTEVFYPQRRKTHRFASALDQKIYDVSVKTLASCMHEHYEDCPWREQALYTMDSRNQMICGYDVFYGHAFQRHSLCLLGKSIKDDGILAICAPAGTNAPIPFFSLIYPIEVAEYIENTGDRSILSEVGETLKTLRETFASRVDESGLIPNFRHPSWNFYEWTEGSAHEEDLKNSDRDPYEDYEKRYDLILNAAYVYAAGYFDRLIGTHTDTEAAKAAIRATFFCERDGLYKKSTLDDGYSQLGNAFALLIGLGGKPLAEKLMTCEKMIPISLSMTTFLYDALLKEDAGHSDFVLGDIREKYKRMLDAGATTFWETELGAEDFGGAGSLCHGWSAMPAYYLVKLAKKQ